MATRPDLFNQKTSLSTFSIHSPIADPLAELELFARSYRHAAATLADVYLKKSFSEYVAYPVVFLYRHSLELALKNLVFESKKLLEIRKLPTQEIDLKGHKFKFWVTQLRRHMKSLFKLKTERGLFDFLSYLEEVTDLYATIDDDSMAFRYPVDVKGAARPGSEATLNLVDFKEVMERILGSLEGLAMWLHELQSEELEAQFREQAALAEMWGAADLETDPLEQEVQEEMQKAMDPRPDW